VAQFQRRYLADSVQAGRVRALALELFDHLQGSEGGRELAHHLTIAAQLHEVGLSISHVNYRRHSAYILQYADIPGFSRREQERLARLVLYHRGKLTRSVLDEFSKEERAALACLRLAVLFNRARQDDAPPISAFSRNNGHYTLEIESGWLDARPLTQHVLSEEMRLWQEIGVQLKLVQRPS
jgi:exopolyphosphatase/guanosine-5'-triphosphate,3'-diphosphate pyrophosphatase